MEENNKKPLIEIKKENSKKSSNFEAVKANNKNTANSKKSRTNNSGFGKTVLVPFVSGVVGCAIVVGTCFGVPSIRTKLLSSNSTTSTSNSSNSNVSGYVSQTSLSNYSDIQRHHHFAIPGTT